MAKELFRLGVEAWSIQFHFPHSFHIDSLNQTSPQGLRITHPDQKLLYLFTQTRVL